MALKYDKKMNYMYQKDLYENFHEITKKHTKIIDINDFTHGFIIKLINKYVIKKSKFLDVGCGTGSIDMYLAKAGHKVLGIDISTRAINSCNETKEKFKLKNAEFEVSSVENLSLKEKFDCILLLEVIEHIEKDEYLLIQLRKHLNDNGVLILSTPSLNAPLYRFGLLDNFDERVGHLRRYSKSSLKKILNESGYKIVEMKKIEGVLRNFLFTYRLGSFILRVINRIPLLANLVTSLDSVLIKILGESNFILVAKKK